MSITELPLTAVTPQVACDLYRDIHKAIRAELFAVTSEAGRLDPGPGIGRAALASHVADVVDLLQRHAAHEDGPIQPVLERELPELAERIETDHLRLERQLEQLRDMASDVAALAAPEPRAGVHRLYLALAAFTAGYLVHIDVEERVVMPALERAVGVEEVAGIHMAILSAIPPEEMARSQALMLPAMNLDDRADMLGGIRASAPPAAFDATWSLARSVLETSDAVDLASRLGIS